MAIRVLLNVLFIALAVSALFQVRKPDRWLGRFFLWIMNRSHSGVTNWGLKHILIDRRFVILDVGCGGGRTIQKLASLAAEGKVFGIDYAKGSVASSRANNAQSIREGRVGIARAAVSQLPFPENTFHLVTAVETQYYWPDPLNDMKQILGVLKPGGTLIVIAESYKSGAYNALQRPVMKVLRSTNMNIGEHRELFAAAGFEQIEVFEERSKGWLCGTGKKPAR